MLVLNNEIEQAQVYSKKLTIAYLYPIYRAI